MHHPSYAIRGCSVLFQTCGTVRQHAVAPRVPLRSAEHPPAGNPPQAWVFPTSDKKDRQDCDQAAPGLGNESAAQNLKG